VLDVVPSPFDRLVACWVGHLKRVRGTNILKSLVFIFLKRPHVVYLAQPDECFCVWQGWVEKDRQAELAREKGQRGPLIRYAGFLSSLISSLHEDAMDSRLQYRTRVFVLVGLEPVL